MFGLMPQVTQGRGGVSAGRSSASIPCSEASGDVPGAAYYEEAFTLTPGRCFRMVDCDGSASPTYCPEPVMWRGQRRALNKRRYQVEPCEGHQPEQEGDSYLGVAGCRGKG